MRLRFPAPLRPGDLVGVTSPSSGVPTELRPRLDVAVRTVRERGFEVEIG
jgi:muramoyltetrapeptide carboxypeptidase LdcA involved in peptidoglycan recycling